MARTPNPKTPSVELTELPEQEIIDTQNVIATVTSEYGEERDLVNQLLGQAQMAGAISKFTSTVEVSKILYVKENKLYQSLAGMKDLDGRGLTGTWEEFCKLLGTSVAKANEDINNLQSFGEKALESMSRMGIGYRELRQYRKLPEDQKTALIEVAKAGDKEALVELAEEFISKHSKEKEELTKQLSDSKADYSALQKRNTDLSKEKEAISIQLNKYELKTIPMDERLEPLKEQIAETQSEIDTLFNDYRQFIELVNKLQFEAMENDPDYDPETSWHLPKPLEITLVMLNNAIALTLEQAKQMHGEIWRLFGEDLEPATSRIIDAESETRLGNM